MVEINEACIFDIWYQIISHHHLRAVLMSETQNSQLHTEGGKLSRYLSFLLNNDSHIYYGQRICKIQQQSKIPHPPKKKTVSDLQTSDDIHLTRWTKCTSEFGALWGIKIWINLQTTTPCVFLLLYMNRNS